MYARQCILTDRRMYLYIIDTLKRVEEWDTSLLHYLSSPKGREIYYIHGHSLDHSISVPPLERRSAAPLIIGLLLCPKKSHHCV
ncbi:hypothetical protein A0H81_01412 [Grifola frondosa]|uniref:Uncharacterized protein n=1 Tax=Grifola frondosa TaxID=5627 RepID=A0A1C7MS85_GRIFR|nr:hypothetical protein A0H81_01412 [Grifola frondosa]